MADRPIEETLAHLIRAVDDLSEVVARHEREIARLTVRVQMLVQRAAEAEADAAGGAGVAQGDQKPPHW